MGASGSASPSKARTLVESEAPPRTRNSTDPESLQWPQTAKPEASPTNKVPQPSADGRPPTRGSGRPSAPRQGSVSSGEGYGPGSNAARGNTDKDRTTLS